jgi:hypothetical protein
MAAISESGSPRRISNFTVPKRLSREFVVGACAVSILATIAAGFTLGGWVTGRAATTLARKADEAGQAKVAGAICADRFLTSPNANAELKVLAQAEPWRKSEILRKGGWLTFPGINDQIPGAAEMCARTILNDPTAANLASSGSPIK